MAFSNNGTMLANLFNPEVIGDLITTKLPNAIKFAPLCTIDTTLEGRPGNTITVPYFSYIGDATVVDEGDDIPIAQLTESTTSATVVKVGIGVQLSDEAVLSGYGNPENEASNQLVMSIASKLDADILATLATISGGMAYASAAGATAFTADDVADAQVKFGEEIDGERVILVSPAQYSEFRKADDWLPASDVSAEKIMSGVVGMIHGCQVVVSNRLTTSGDAYIVKPGALRVYLKRDTLVETDRDIVNKSTVLTADKHYVVYLYDASKAIKMSLTAVSTP